MSANDRSNRISRLLSSQKSRTAYIKAKLGVLVPAQIRALRMKSTNPPMPFQRDLAREAEVHQSRISMFETPGMANVTLETLAKIAAGLRSGVIVKFVPFSEMLRWENSFSPVTFDVTPRLERDEAFLDPGADVALVSLAASMESDNSLAGLRKQPQSEEAEAPMALAVAAGGGLSTSNNALGG